MPPGERCGTILSSAGGGDEDKNIKQKVYTANELPAFATPSEEELSPNSLAIIIIIMHPQLEPQ
jgi:hypothetical protein